MGLFKSDNDRHVKQLRKIADTVEVLSDKYKAMTDEELKAVTPVLKERVQSGEKLYAVLPDAYALVREASARVLHMRHFYVQILGGIALYQGRIAEMRTGEGKTLVETLPAYLNALKGLGVHIVTVNEYLASRDAEWMGKVFKFLGLTVGVTLSGMSMQDKKKAYECDITYGTNAEFGFDYLRDNMVVDERAKVQRSLDFAIIDEVDSVLIDEARTPLIISGAGNNLSNESYANATRFAKGLRLDADVEVDEEKKQVRLTEEGIQKAERYFNVENLSDLENIELNHFILNAVRAKYLMKKDINYIVKGGEILIVDEFTGRVLSGRRFSDGLHQAIESKEGVEIKNENRTMATITYQNYFRLYKKLSGMTGTAKTEETEFNKIYNLDVVVIPTNMPIARKDRNDLVFKNNTGKISAVVNEIKERHKTGQPMLVGTTTVEKSEVLSNALKRERIPHVVLNAKNHEKESEIVAQAGQVGAVTIATNMAGRGTDILLGGNPEFLAKQKMKQEGFEEFYIIESTSFATSTDEKVNEAKARFTALYNEFKKETDKEKEQVISVGGLFVLGTERHESRRIDNQLRGRSGRQGDPGESVFFISLEDDLARLFGGERLKSIANFFNLPEEEPITNMRLMSRQIELAQKRIEGMNFARRRDVLQFDDVLAKQREIIYEERNKVLAGATVHEEVLEMIKEQVSNAVHNAISDAKLYSEWNLEELNKSLEDKIFPKGTNFITPEKIEDMEVQEVVELVLDEVVKNYDTKAEETTALGIPFDNIERTILLRQVDRAWIEHIDLMTILRNEIFTRTDPINTYKKEGYEMFEGMIERIREGTSTILLNARVEKVNVERKPIAKNLVAGPVKQKTLVNKDQKVGRNDPCPCGSGKKYKNCCGKNA
ncbi:MAG: preprotein translocase subunit SecA [Spirochaetales bacterium]